jgi:hypothetical protein
VLIRKLTATKSGKLKLPGNIHQKDLPLGKVKFIFVQLTEFRFGLETIAFASKK